MGAVDAYSATNTKALSVAATTGVLTNDVDLDGDAKTAALVAGPAHGTLTLSANGSFSYTSAAGYVGTDSFTYSAVDADGRSTPTTVTLMVKAATK
jgi:VCBS repeat-containing protein